MLKYALVNIVDQHGPTATIHAWGLTTACAAMRLAGVPVVSVDVFMATNGAGTDVCVHIDTTEGGLNVDGHIAADAQTPPIEVIARALTTRGKLTQRLAAPMPACLEAGHPGLLGAMHTCARLMHADAQRLGVRDRLAASLRLARPEGVHTQRLASLAEEGTPTHRLRRTAEQLYSMGALPWTDLKTVAEVCAWEEASWRTWEGGERP